MLASLAERTALLADAVGGLSTLVADRVLVREGQRVAAELTLLQKRQEVRCYCCRHFAQRLPTRRERGNNIHPTKGNGKNLLKSDHRTFAQLVMVMSAHDCQTCAELSQSQRKPSTHSPGASDAGTRSWS